MQDNTVKLDELEVLLGVIRVTDSNFMEYTYSQIKQILKDKYQFNCEEQDIKLLYELPILNDILIMEPNQKNPELEKVKEDLEDEFGNIITEDDIHEGLGFHFLDDENYPDSYEDY